MAASGGVVSRSACQGLLQAVARPRARSRLLICKSRWISSEEQARLARIPGLRPKGVKERDRGIFQNSRKIFKTIDQSSFVACKERVGLVDSAVQCLCSWNEASGSTQAIYVPGDASRPRKTSPSLSGLAAGTSLGPATKDRPWGYCNPGRGIRGGGWDDALAALCATDPELKLDNVDVMIPDDVLLRFLLVAQNGEAPFFGNPLNHPDNAAIHMMLVGNTLVIQRRMPVRHQKMIQIPTCMPGSFWEYYKLATEPVPAVEESSVHQQLLRYNIGPLSCLVKARVHGTVQEMPTSTGPFEAQKPRKLHGVDVIKAGHGVHPTFAFQATARPANSGPETEARRLKTLTARLWLSGQTRLGVANVVPVDQIEELGGLTVLEMAELVRKYEQVNQTGLRRLVGLLEALRHTVGEFGAPSVGRLLPPSGTARGNMARQQYAINVGVADSNEDPILLDSHKEHFWSQNKVPKKQVGGRKNEWSQKKVPRNQVQPGNKTTKEQSQPQGKVNDEPVHAPKGFIGKLARWLGL